MNRFNGIPLLGQAAARSLDMDLMQVPGFSIDQLMELAGLSVASAIANAYPKAKDILAIVGPGNNGGDAFVAARHLCHFGYNLQITYPKPVKKPLFDNLQAQMKQLNIDIFQDLPENWDTSFDLIIDGIFGFSFDPSKGIRAPFDSIVSDLVNASTPLVSIDIPSGWHVEKGPTELETFLKPEMLVSLTAPKLCAKYFKGKHHYLGGRFVPPFIVDKYSLQELPKYPGSSQFIRLPWDEDSCL